LCIRYWLCAPEADIVLTEEELAPGARSAISGWLAGEAGKAIENQ